VELVVVITILAILGTIAFISLQWYSSQARDSTRLSDLSTIKTTLELFQIDAWKYPEPDWWDEVTYSWAEVWTQWIFGDLNLTNVRNLNKVPTDPLVWNNYTYSRLNTWIEYELWSILESWWLSSIDLLENTYAADNFESLITWNYNWIIAKVSTWWTTYVLAIPSIISTDIWEVTLEWILTNQKLSVNWTDNLPSSYKSSTNTWWFDFNSADLDKIIVYEWDISDLSSSGWLQRTFIEALQDAYTWTTITDNSDINNILAADTTLDESWSEFLAIVLIQQTIDSSIEIPSTYTSWSTNESTSSWVSLLKKVWVWLEHTCAIDNWWVKCWGENDYWQLWDNTTNTRTTPNQIATLTGWVISISLWRMHTCALLNTWWVKCWGQNSAWQLWDDTIIERHIPTDVFWLDSWVIDISSWTYHTCALLDTWSVECWWTNTSWQIWDNTNNLRLKPTQVDWLTSWVINISVGESFSCALLDTWSVKCWWYNAHWEIWDTTTTERKVPTLVDSLSSAIDISSWDYHTCVRLDTLSVQCWWYGAYSVLWNWTTHNKNTPEDVTVISDNATKLFTWRYTSCVILDTWVAKCWGYNFQSQTSAASLLPVGEVIDIAPSIHATCALLDSWSLKCWWDNINRQVWDWTRNDHSTPYTVY